MSNSIFSMAMLGLCLLASGADAAPRGDAAWRPTERWRGFNLLGMFISRRHA